MAVNAVSILHILGTIFAIVELGLTAYWASLFHGWWTPSSIDFLLFTSVWSLLVLFYVALASTRTPSIFNRTAALAANALTAIFWFAGAIAVAVWFGGPYACGGDRACSNAEAAIAFGFFLWAIFTVLAIIDAIEFLRRRGHTVNTNKSTNAYPNA
ncbi:membrane-associating domain-containing protein [Xylaria sp. CBS 124048]|nr:membrane-associating domain-containing protein [Xylaria sp. CBS 124048]